MNRRVASDGYGVLRARAAPPGTSVFVPLRPRHRVVILGSLVLYYLAVVGAALFVPREGVTWILVGLAVYLGLLAALIALVDESAGWLHPLVFCILWSLGGLARAFPMYAWGLEYHGAIPRFSAARLDELVAYELGVNALGLAAYIVGFLAMRTPGVPRVTLRQPPLYRSKAVAVVALSSAAFAMYIAAVGGVTAHIDSWALGRHEALEGSFYAVTVIHLGVYACLIWLAYDRAALRNPLFLLSCGFALGATFLTTGSRSEIIYPVIVGVMVIVLRERRLHYGKALVAIVVGFAVLGALGQFRRSAWTGAGERVGQVELSMPGLLSGFAELTERSTNESGTLPILAFVPGDVGLLYGDSYLAILTAAVPRAWWPEKPGLIGGRVGAEFFNIRAGVPAGAVGEAYWNFHLPGVFAVFLLFGAFHAWLAKGYRRYAGEPAAVLLYAGTLLLVAPDSSSIVSGFFLTIVPLGFLLVAFGALSFRRPAPPPRDRG